ncbi:MAG: T9SS type A sorting domain-containing protein [Saprospiraceae bacterium]|nr:T9SS type A sorting domain-containing protein [Saprospiraceae bacterium]
MKYCLQSLTLFLGLFSATIAFGQNGTSQKLRSTVWLNAYPVSGMIFSSDSTQYYYDDNGRYSDIYHWTDYTPAGGWRLSNRTTAYVYDPNGNLLSTLTQKHVDTLGWLNVYRNIYTYDSKDSLLSMLEQRYNDSAGWVNYLRFFLSYDDAGNRLSSVVETWNDSVWALNNAMYFTYDAAGNVLTRTTDDFYRLVYAYDGAGNLSSETSMHLDNGIWYMSSRRIYLPGFSPAFPATGVYYQLWENMSWSNYSRLHYTYNASGDLTESLYQYKSGQEWTNESRYHAEFNQNHQEVFMEYQEWENNAWSKHTRYFTTYDADSDIILRQRKQWNGAWYEISTERFHYEETSPVNTPKHDDLLLFPNPTIDAITLKGTNMLYAQIYNTKGELVTSSALFGADEKTFQLGNIPTGHYFLHLLMKDGSVSTKSFQVQK